MMMIMTLMKIDDDDNKLQLRSLELMSVNTQYKTERGIALIAYALQSAE